MLGLYIHVPFCAAICNYCNFTRGLFDGALEARYLQALVAEIGRATPDAEPPSADTLYFGGGTPSLLSPAEVAEVTAACRTRFRLAAGAEVTLEANPETVDAGRLDAFRRAGVTRLSYGVQSFRDDELRRLERMHSAARAVEAVRLARAAGFDNVSIDLMMWLPGQSVDQWLESVDRAIGVDPDHISLYMLEVYPHLPLRAQMAARRWEQLPDDAAAEMYERAMEALERAGYEQYEISNVARPGRRSRHNLKYWSDGEWLGFGPAAHSTRGGVRWRNVSSTDEYIQRIARGETVVAEERRLSADERLGDALFTALRLSDGVPVPELNARYQTDVWSRFGQRLAPYVEAGLLVNEGSRMRLSRRGMLLAHEVMSVFV